MKSAISWARAEIFLFFVLIMVWSDLPFSAGTTDRKYFLPKHEEILRESGWFDYVCSNVDVVQYYEDSVIPTIGIHKRLRLLWGFTFRNPGDNKRGIMIASRGEELDVARTIVHEAGHWDFDIKHGQNNLMSEAYAKHQEKLFFEDYNKVKQPEFYHNWLAIVRYNPWRHRSSFHGLHFLFSP